MSNGFTKFLRRCRDNYYLSTLLAYSSKPLHSISRRVAVRIERSVRKNGVTIRLPNGKDLTIGRDAGIAIGSLVFWHGLDGYEPETPCDSCLSVPQPLLTSARTAVCTPSWGRFGIQISRSSLLSRFLRYLKASGETCGSIDWRAGFIAKILRYRANPDARRSSFRCRQAWTRRALGPWPPRAGRQEKARPGWKFRQ